MKYFLRCNIHNGLLAEIMPISVTNLPVNKLSPSKCRYAGQCDQQDFLKKNVLKITEC
jgi:hypothetical protein